MSKKPRDTIVKLINERYKDAKTIFWAGSVSKDQGTDASDLDLIIIYDKVEHAYREAFIYDDWPIDSFIHDLETLSYFFEKIESKDGRPALIQMILNGVKILGTNDFAQSIKDLAQKTLNAGPDIWTQEVINKERFLITDILDDIRFPKTQDEQMTSAVHLFEPLIQFYFRSQNKWTASGKALIRDLKNENPALASEYIQCFTSLFQTGDFTKLQFLIEKILEPYGGLLWDGFRLDAPKEWRKDNIYKK